MALIKCPECGKENVSSTAESCPGCGYRIKAHFEKTVENKSLNNDTTANNELNKSAVIKLFAILIGIFLILCIYAFYQESKCNWLKCDELSIDDSKYCKKHTCTTAGCLGGKDAWSNVCNTCHEKNLKKLEEDNTIQKLHDELVDKYAEDIFSDELHMPSCNMSGCDNEGSSTYGGKWYCSKHLYEMQGYGNIISD